MRKDIKNAKLFLHWHHPEFKVKHRKKLYVTFLIFSNTSKKSLFKKLMQIAEIKNDMNAEEHVHFDVATEGFSFSLNPELVD